jgi:membrane protein implicated in regulation of membrane protease activity
LGGLTTPGETILHFSRSAYLHQVVRGAYLWLISGSFALYLLLGGLAIWLNRTSLYSDMIAAVLAARAVSYGLYPNGDQRYTAVLFVLIPVALVIAIRLSTLRTSTSTAGRQADETSLGGLSTANLSPDPAVSGTIAR